MEDTHAGPYGARLGSQAAGGKLTWDRIVFILVSVLTLFARFRSRAFLIGSYQDDFFYYLKVAQNIAGSGVSTFDGTHLTNGYHPLWMAVLVLLNTAFHGTVFFAALQGVSLIAALLSYALLLRIFRLLVPNVVARAGSFVLGMEALMLIRYGMEVTLTLPLALLLIWLLLRDGYPQRFRHATWLGFVSSLLVLSRLDASILLVLLAAAAAVAAASTRPSRSAVVGFLCGMLPLLALYFGFNLHLFHLLTPVSGLAKQTKPGLLPSAQAWKSFVPTDRMRAVVLFPELILIAAGLFAACRWERQEQYRSRHTILTALLLFPLIHLTILSMVSDWTVWPWYFYSVTLAALGAYMLLASRSPGPWLARMTFAYGGVLVLYACAYAIKGPNSLSVYESSLQVAQYMDAHPGVYLMGDQAGTTAYLSHQPVVQAEGLVMDRGFLQHMHRGDPLRNVAVAYGARYYAVIGASEQGGCYVVAEPTNAGPGSPRMRGSICHEPLVTVYRQADHTPIRIFRAEWIH